MAASAPRALTQSLKGALVKILPMIARRRRRSSLAVIGMTGKDLLGTVKLLQQHNPREEMRPGH
jgi:hypothetical protein